MADPTRQAIDRMGELRRLEPTESGAAEIRKTLGAKSNWAVAAAAEAAKTYADTPMAESLWAPLEKAFVRFIENHPETTDKGCKAKKTIAEALRALECPRSDVYLRGVRHVQMEGVFGGFEDTAASLRGECAIGLMDCRHPEALHECILLLGDSLRPARIGAVKALGASGRPEAALLLRLAIVKGDEEPEVVAEAMAELMALDPRGAFDFVLRYLESDDDAVAEAAALALGSSRQERVLEILSDKWSRTRKTQLRKSLLAAIATLRLEPAYAFLAERVAEGRRTDALDALEALAFYRGDPHIQELATGALAKRENDGVAAEAARLGFR
ncbi:MAG: HEAT repeat domain-containing protein [Bryobacteraceae bacterium]